MWMVLHSIAIIIIFDIKIYSNKRGRIYKLQVIKLTPQKVSNCSIRSMFLGSFPKWIHNIVKQSLYQNIIMKKLLVSNTVIKWHFRTITVHYSFFFGIAGWRHEQWGQSDFEIASKLWNLNYNSIKFPIPLWHYKGGRGAERREKTLLLWNVKH